MLHKTTLLFLALALISVAFGEDNDGGAGAAYKAATGGNSSTFIEFRGPPPNEAQNAEFQAKAPKTKSSATFVR
ncbi:unnamed protein product [Caenorhabditis nigoni]